MVSFLFGGRAGSGFGGSGELADIGMDMKIRSPSRATIGLSG
jgi:hypothetical protein